MIGIKTAKQHLEKIEEIAATSDLNYIEVIVDYCYKNNIEVESVAAAIKSLPKIKKKVKKQAKDLNMLK